MVNANGDVDDLKDELDAMLAEDEMAELDQVIVPSSNIKQPDQIPSSGQKVPAKQPAK